MQVGFLQDGTCISDYKRRLAAACGAWRPEVFRPSTDICGGGFTMRRLTQALFVLSWTLLTPAIALAQASITGVVQDASAGVLPGVTVEASSPALIEKTRTSVTDGNGRFQIVDLRPGLYRVTFTLPGFSTVARDGVELSGSSVVRVDAELRVGSLQETVTVTGESPLIDVQT